MAIAGRQPINIGLPNQPAGSDSLYVAFTKTDNNFQKLFENASQYVNFATSGAGVGIVSSGNTVTFTNTGVTSINPGTGITVNQSNGAVTISASGNGNIGVTSVGINSTTLSVSNTPIVSNGNIVLNLTNSGVTAGTYTYPTLTIDSFGRVTNASNAASVGTVTSVAINGGDGIGVANSPITTSGTITITNTGVTRLNAGAGIVLSGSKGNVTITARSVVTPGTVTSVGVSSNALTVTNSPIVTNGTIAIDLPTGYTYLGAVGTSLSANGTNQTDATLVGNALNIVSTVSSGSADGVRLPGAVAGRSIKIVNTSASTLKVYPASGDSINALVADASFSMSSNARVEFAAVDSSTWYTFVG